MKLKNLRRTRLFKEVASVIGRRRAKVEIEKLLLQFGQKSGFGWVDLEETLLGSFTWHNSTQGWEFWNRIHSKIECGLKL